MNDKGLREALEIFGESYIAELSNQLRKLDKKASGDLLRSLDSRVIQTAFGTKYTIVLQAENYLKYVDGGRGAGKTPPPVTGSKGKPLRDWARIKGFPPSAVWGIAKNIGKFGIKPTHVIKKSLDATLNGIRFRHLEDGMSDWVDDMIDQMMLDISKNNNITVR